MSTEGFPFAVPVMVMTLEIGIPMLIGSVSRGTPCTVVPITGGKLTSLPTFPILLDASFIGTGNDYIHNDPDGKLMRLNTHAVVRDRRDELIYIKYKGIIEITPELSNILGGSVHSKSTEFGHSFIHIEFETGCSRYKDLETSLFVGAGRFVVDEKKGRVSVEYKLSKILSNVQLAASDASTMTESGG